MSLPDRLGARSDFERKLEEMINAGPDAASSSPAPDRGSDAAGTVEIRAGSAVIIDPVGLGTFPVIVPGPGVVIRVDGRVIEGATVVTSTAKVVLEAPPRPPQCLMSVNLSEPGLEAELRVERIAGQQLTINDSPPSPRLTVTAAVAREIEAPPPSIDQVVRFLAAHGVIYGIDLVKVREAVESGRAIVARGDQPVPGKDGHLECFVASLAEWGEAVSAVEGTVVARKRTARPGTPGKAVTGAVVMPPPPRDIPLGTGPGVALIDHGLTAVATQPGRALLKNNQLSVLPVYVFGQAKAGNLALNGHLLVKGNAGPGVKIRASGDVKILGDARQAIIVAGGSVHVDGSLTDSVVRAGGLDVAASFMILGLEELVLELDLLYNSLCQVKTHPSYLVMGRAPESDAPLVRLLLDRKFPRIPQLLGKFLEPGGYPIDEESLRVLTICARKYPAFGPAGVRRAEDIPADLRVLRQLIDRCKGNINAPAGIYASWVRDCTLEASGGIHIKGAGCQRSELRAGQSVLVEGSGGVFQGGTITSGGDICVKALGAPTELTKVNLLPGRRLAAETLEANVALKAGRQSIMTSARHHAEAYLDERGVLQVTGVEAPARSAASAASPGLPVHDAAPDPGPTVTEPPSTTAAGAEAGQPLP